MPNPLIELIKGIIQTDGKITFARFMETALYHPEFGYYNNAKPKIGKEGDFYTSPDVHPFIGRVLAEVMRNMWWILGSRDFFIVEIGAGKGILAMDILNDIKGYNPQFYKHITYIIIEKSPAFKAKQHELLADYQEKVLWVDSLSCLKDKGGFTGCLLSNELLDSFPFHCVMQKGKHLKELYVTYKNGKFVEEIGELSTNDLSDHLKRLKIGLPDGARTEINLEIMKWVRGVAAALNNGFVLTIDYGFPSHLYYAPFRDKGTLLCYFQHTANEEPFERVGKQDITAHVDFTSLTLEGSACGLDLLAFTDLSSFLTYCGSDILEKEIENGLHKSAYSDSYDQIKSFKTLSAIKSLIHPEGMGGRFKVLVQGKGIKTSYLAEMTYNKKDLLKIDN